MKRLQISLLALTLAALLPLSLSAKGDLIYPDKEHGWSKAAPEKYGYDSKAFAEVTDYIIKNTAGTGMCVIVGGEMIYQYGSITRQSYIASCRKSVLAMLYGKYVEDGTIDLSRTIGELGMDDIGGLLPIEKTATVYDLITARSGVYHAASNAGDDLAYAPPRGTQKPGQYYLYNNWDFNAAGAAFEIMTGKNIYDVLDEDIAKPIDMQDWDRAMQSKTGDLTVSQYPAYHFIFSTRDMARLGYLMLRNGVWNGQQVISKDWVKKMTSPVTPFSAMQPPHRKDRYSYGYMWWLFDDESEENDWQYHNGYIARGAMGQFIVVLPEIDMVVAFKTDRIYGRRTQTKDFYAVLDMVVHATLKKAGRRR